MTVTILSPFEYSQILQSPALRSWTLDARGHHITRSRQADAIPLIGKNLSHLNSESGVALTIEKAARGCDRGSRASISDEKCAEFDMYVIVLQIVPTFVADWPQICADLRLARIQDLVTSSKHCKHHIHR